MTISRQSPPDLRFCILLFWLSAAGCSAEENTTFSVNGHQYDAKRLTQYQLPGVLREISGLALTDTGEVLAHNDEQAVIYRFDAIRGEMLGSFQLGRNPVRDDFEGITTLGQRVFLISSSGVLYEARVPLLDEDADPGIAVPVAYTRYQVRLPCEVEGLASASTTRLLAACKTLTDGKDVLRIYAWDVVEQSYLDTPFLSLKKRAFKAFIDKPGKLRPSGLTVTDDSALILIGRHDGVPVLVEIAAEGEVLSVQHLPDLLRHPQPEGISITRSHQLLIADEGSKTSQTKSRGRLSVYHPN